MLACFAILVVLGNPYQRYTYPTHALKNIYTILNIVLAVMVRRKSIFFYELKVLLTVEICTMVSYYELTIFLTV